MEKTTVYSFLKEHFSKIAIGFPAGALYGTPKKLFGCILPDGSLVYVGLLEAPPDDDSLWEDRTPLLVVSEAEYNQAWLIAVSEFEESHHFPYGEENEPEDFYYQAIYEPAYQVIDAVAYWLS